jgi:hypothetical protein
MIVASAIWNVLMLLHTFSLNFDFVRLYIESDSLDGSARYATTRIPDAEENTVYSAERGVALLQCFVNTVPKVFSAISDLIIRSLFGIVPNRPDGPVENSDIVVQRLNRVVYLPDFLDEPCKLLDQTRRRAGGSGNGGEYR